MNKEDDIKNINLDYKPGFIFTCLILSPFVWAATVMWKLENL